MAEPTPAPAPAGTVPEVSIIIPAYGVAPYIGETLASVVAQTATNWEVIVVNDGCPDTLALEAALEPYRSRIIYRVQRNQGAAAARNSAIQIARGTWLAFLDGDDWWEPTFLKRQLQFLKKHDLDMVWSDGWVFGNTQDDGRRIMELRPCRGPVTVAALLNQSVVVGTSATLVSRALVESVGGFDERLLRAQDFELWVRLMNAGVRAGYNPEPLIHYRVRSDSLSGDAISQAIRAIDVLKHIGDTLELSAADRTLLLNRVEKLRAEKSTLEGKAHLVARDYKAAAACFRQASSLAPSTKLSLMRAMLAVSPAAARRIYLARHPAEAT